MGIGDLVKYIPGVRSEDHDGWRYKHVHKSSPGIILREIDENGTTTRRFEIRWHGGQTSEEWMSYLESYSV